VPSRTCAGGVTVDRGALILKMGVATFDERLAFARAGLDGGRKAFDPMHRRVVAFAPDYPIRTGTAPQAKVAG